MHRIRTNSWIHLLTLAALLIAAPFASAQESVRMGRDGHFEFARDEQGNHIPDFSHCGYAGGNEDIPTVDARVVVTPVDGDDGPRIQAAIDYVSNLPIEESGFRGAVLLEPGEFQVEGQLRIAASGVVLRGSGAGEGGTILVATGLDRRQLIRIEGQSDRELQGDALSIIDEYVPVGANEFHLESSGDLKPGDRVLIVRPSTVEWIKAIGADAFGIGWRPGTRDIRWGRAVIAVDGNNVTVDAPVTTALEEQYGGGTVQKVRWPGRLEHVGVEDLQLRSSFDAANPLDEDHAWFGITIENVEDAWVRRVEFRHFAGGAVLLREHTKNVSVVDCVSLEPVSEMGGYRRHTFFTQGQQTLFLRCWSEHGRHDFAVGHCAPGPNAFVSCFASEALDDSGPLECWASGVLYDNVRIDGAALKLVNRWISPPATGWSAANCVLWQCRSATMHCFCPPTANNWSIGCWSQFYGDGTYEGRTDFVSPLSLYQGQLRARVGNAAAERVDPILLKVRSATNPTYEEAAELVADSNHPAPLLIDAIRERFQQAIGDAVGEPAPIEEILTRSPRSAAPAADVAKSLTVENGWLVIDGKVKTGSSFTPMWWRGNIRPDEVAQFGPSVTRFAPGRDGLGLTDELVDVAEWMCDRNVAVLDHHYGLWYDRRRDTHLMVREEDGDVAPPFYEQPFARAGIGTAWDGLSRFDLTRFNPWYWRRLGEFANLCDRHGLVLFHQNYFQHNILEAGAHWADCPWRTANNVNAPGFPEPPPYVGDKRIFQAHLFYDVSDPHRRELHRGYIRQCLDNFAENSNVVQFTSAEYTGPLEFTQFWLDTIAEWQRERGRNVLVALSCTKDVQDAILADPERSKLVDVIDIRYWTYLADGQLYAPAGGKNLAPRQHARQLHPGPTSFASVVRSVSEYRRRYPDKAVVYNANGEIRGDRNGWAVLMGGGSLPDVALPDELASLLPTLQPADGDVSPNGPWRLQSNDGAALVYSKDSDATIKTSWLDRGRAYEARWINPRTGEIISRETIRSGSQQSLQFKTNVLWVMPNE